jgi:hypothetical protein
MGERVTGARDLDGGPHVYAFRDQRGRVSGSLGLPQRSAQGSMGIPACVEAR